MHVIKFTLQTHGQHNKLFVFCNIEMETYFAALISSFHYRTNAISKHIMLFVIYIQCISTMALNFSLKNGRK